MPADRRRGLGGTWRNWVFVTMVITGIALAVAALYIWVSSHVGSGRREFIEDCRGAGFRVVELGQQLVCVNQDGIKIASWEPP